MLVFGFNNRLKEGQGLTMSDFLNYMVQTLTASNTSIALMKKELKRQSMRSCVQALLITAIFVKLANTEKQLQEQSDKIYNLEKELKDFDYMKGE